METQVDAASKQSAPSMIEPAPGGTSRLQHFQAPARARKPYKRRYSDATDAVIADEAEKGGLEATPQQRQRKSLDESELKSGEAHHLKNLPDVVLEAMRKRGARAGVTSSESADTKGRRYAEMVERFQIRLVNRPLSSSSTGAAGGVTNASTSSALSFRDKTARDPSEYYVPSTTSNKADLQGSQTNRSSAPPLVPPLESLSSRLEKAFNEFGRLDIDQNGLTPREGTVKIDRSIRFSLHWLLVSWKRRVARGLKYIAQNISKPISPSSGLSRIRLVVLMLAFTVHVVLFPLETAFLPDGNNLEFVEAMEIVIENVLIVDLLLMFNTAFYNKKNRLVTSRRLIARNYLRGWFVPDLLSSVPVDLILMMTNGVSVQTKWLHFMYDVAFRSQRIIHVVRIARFMWTVLLDSPERSVFEWLLYSRYSHLLRISWIILCIILIAHYLACGWRLLFISTPMRGSPLEEYVACFYDVLQLLQGQGVPTTTVAQNIYAAVAILMGSIALAIIFGNVAILVSNFNANATSYQRKMESVFAIMSKLQLPAPLRERIHQYYEHLWREYESLDGEIVAFSKGLSHTLELEVVLFKYMDLIMHVPFWRDASPDFQKQLMLSLHVRVYLPDDFIIRRGEVGDEFFMINRGICELALGPDSFECTIDPLEDQAESSFSEAEQDHGEQVPKTARFDLSPDRQSDHTPPVPRGRRGSRPNVYSLGEPKSSRATVEPSLKYIHKLRRGQSFGEIALLMNYERTANVRALTYVEMCVLHRRDFQRILIKHPTDRKQVLTKMLTKTMENNEATSVWCPLKATVQSVFREGNAERAEPISATHAALLISNAINLPLDDDSIKFGVGARLRDQLVELRDTQQRNSGTSASSSVPVNVNTVDGRQNACPPGSRSTTRSATTNVKTTELATNGPIQESVEFKHLADQVGQLRHVQTCMASTMLDLAQEVRLLRAANEQLHNTISVYQSRLTELLSAKSPPPLLRTSSTPKLRATTRRLSRKSSQGTLEDVQETSILEHKKPRVVSVKLARSASMSSIHSARSYGPGQDSTGPNVSADDYGSPANSDTAQSRRASHSGLLRSHTTRSLVVNVLGPPSSISGSLMNPHDTALPTRGSFSKRILMPLRALLGPDASTTPSPSPTKYADQLFHKK